MEGEGEGIDREEVIIIQQQQQKKRKAAGGAKSFTEHVCFVVVFRNNVSFVSMLRHCYCIFYNYVRPVYS